EQFQPLEMDLAEVADGAEVGDVVAHDDAAGDIGQTPAHDLARGPGAGGVAVEQQCHHHPRVERRLAPEVALVMRKDGREVEGGDGVEEKIEQIPFGKPVLGRGREDVALVGRPLAIGLAHTTLSPDRVTGDQRPPYSSNLDFERQYSDRLLAHVWGETTWSGSLRARERLVFQHLRLGRHPAGPKSVVTIQIGISHGNSDFLLDYPE